MITNEYINRAIDYILGHINEDISVSDIASHCNFSRFYFSRMFKMEMGEGVHEFIKRVKMEQSAFRLKVEKSRSITEKSLTNPVFHDAVVNLEGFDEINSKISIEVLNDFPVIFERHKGNYGDLSEHWGAFQEKYRHFMTEKTLLLERTYDDPSITDTDECLYDLCMTIPDGSTPASTCVITGGKFAIYHFEGSVDQIYTAYQCIFNVWLPKSKREIDDRYGFEIYREINCNSMCMKIDLCIPIK